MNVIYEIYVNLFPGYFVWRIRSSVKRKLRMCSVFVCRGESVSQRSCQKIQAQASTFFSLRIFLYYIDIHMVNEREKCSPLRLNVSRAVNVGAELKVYGNVS